ncbi:MAG: thiamine-phosphate kinase [Candidatus Verstraetearchaeota archaeon]|nr:thiamine-phosphate kinase [Candidatus Verstraetearchaeota archaeon]
MLLRARDIGERGLIKLIWELVDRGARPEIRGNALPHPDDASALQLNDGRYIVIKTDMFVKRTDAPRGMRHFQMGRKSVVMCASDLAAKGARPRAFMHSMGVPSRYSSKSVLELVEGVLSACSEYDLTFLGGDLGESRDLLVAGFMVGFADRLIKRSGASPGDVLVVTGPFGDTASALEILLKGKRAPPRLRRHLLRSIYLPNAKVDLGVALAGTGAVSSSMDSSDGLAFTLHELARSSGVRLALSKVPVSSAAVEFAAIHGIPAESLALYGGEEYELVLTVKPGALEEAKSAAERCGSCLIPIGVVEEGKGVFITEGGAERPVEAKGWEHFKR